MLANVVGVADIVPMGQRRMRHAIISASAACDCRASADCLPPSTIGPGPARALGALEHIQFPWKLNVL
jgi:hypothetical protein